MIHPPPPILHIAIGIACGEQTYFRSSLLSLRNRTERSDDGKYVCSPQATIGMKCRLNWRQYLCIFFFGGGGRGVFQLPVFPLIIAVARLIATLEQSPPFDGNIWNNRPPTTLAIFSFFYPLPVKLKWNLVQQNWSVTMQALTINQGTKFETLYRPCSVYLM